MLPLPLAPPAVVDVLMGGVPTGGEWVSRDVEAGPDATWRLGLRAADGRVADLWVDRDAPRVRRIVLPRGSGQPRIEVELDDHEGVVARQIDLRVPDRKLSVQIRLQSPEYDAALDPSLFIIESPPGRPTVAW